MHGCPVSLGISSSAHLLSQRSTELPANPALPSYLPHAEVFRASQMALHINVWGIAAAFSSEADT